MLTGFLAISLMGVLMISITSLLAYEVLRYVWIWLPGLTIAPRLRVLLIVVPIFIIHIINIWLYAGAYFIVENYTDYGQLTGAVLATGLNYEAFVEALYFSASTYTSLGFGDVTPSLHLRMLASAEVLNGLVMIGWTVSFTYLTMEKFWLLPHSRSRND